MPDEPRTRTPDTRGFVAEDLLSFRVLLDLDLSPDGATIVYALQSIDEKGDTTFSNLWRVAAAGGPPVQLTFGHDLDDSPRFSPDGAHLAFVSNRSGSSQLFVLSLDGGEARPVTNLRGGPGPAAWSPDGTRLAFSGSVVDDAPPHAPRATRRSTYKLDGSGFIGNQPTQIFVVDVAGGEARQLTHGPSSALEPRWSPDGRRLVFTRMRDGRTDGHRSDVWVIDEDGGEARAVTQRSAHSMSPAFSPDGSSIVYYGSEREGDARRVVWLVSTGGGDERVLASEDDEVASFPLARTKPPVFDAEGRTVAVVTATASRSAVSMVSLADGTVRRVLDGNRQITMAVASAKGNRLAFVWSELHVCGLLGSSSWNGSDERKLVDANEAWSARRAWPTVEMREVASHDGAKHECLLLLPKGEGPWPLLVDVHGGPQSFVELGYPYHPYWYELVSRGWAVMSLNPVGSSSYGQEASEKLRGRWGVADLPEHLAVVDALAEEGVVDASRIAIAGKSYGGYMASWAIGNSERFRAAVCSAGVTNLESHFGTSDSGHYVDPFDLAGHLFDARERFHQLSPVRHACRSKTPTLILQGEDDQRCPVGQAEELFQSLLHASDVDVELVLYPGGDHHLAETGRPSHRVDYNTRIVAWLERHVMGRDV